MNSRWKPVIIRSSCMCPCHDSRESFIQPPTPVCTSSVALVLPSCWRQTRLEFLLHRLKSVTSWTGSLDRDWSLFFTVCDWQYLQRALKLPSQLLIHMGNKRLWYQHRGPSLLAQFPVKTLHHFLLIYLSVLHFPLTCTVAGAPQPLWMLWQTETEIAPQIDPSFGSRGNTSPTSVCSCLLFSCVPRAKTS